MMGRSLVFLEKREAVSAELGIQMDSGSPFGHASSGHRGLEQLLKEMQRNSFVARAQPNRCGAAPELMAWRGRRPRQSPCVRGVPLGG